MNALWGDRPATQARPRTHPEERLQRVTPTLRSRYPPRRGLRPAHKRLLPCSSAEIGPRGAPRRHGDDVQTALSVTANLTPRLPPAVAGRFAPESRRTTGGA